MTDADWRALILDFVSGRSSEAAFHDRFLAAWRATRDAGEPLPPPVGDLFYVVEAYCPDPALRNPASPCEADDAELRLSAEQAFRRLQSPLPPVGT